MDAKVSYQTFIFANITGYSITLTENTDCLVDVGEIIQNELH